MSIIGGGSIQKTLNFAPDRAGKIAFILSLRTSSLVFIASETKFIKKFDISTEACLLTIPDTNHSDAIGSMDQSHGNSNFIIVNTGKTGGLLIYDHSSAGTAALQTYFPVMSTAAVHRTVFSESLPTRVIFHTNSEKIYFLDID